MAETIKITGKAEIKITASQIRDKSVENKKIRGPKQIGQLKNNLTVSLGLLTRDELKKRTKVAAKILETGKLPAAPKGKDASVDLKARIKELEAEVKSLTPTPPKEKKPETKKPAAKKK